MTATGHSQCKPALRLALELGEIDMYIYIYVYIYISISIYIYIYIYICNDVYNGYSSSRCALQFEFFCRPSKIPPDLRGIDRVQHMDLHPMEIVPWQRRGDFPRWVDEKRAWMMPTHFFNTPIKWFQWCGNSQEKLYGFEIRIIRMGVLLEPIQYK